MPHERNRRRRAVCVPMNIGKRFLDDAEDGGAGLVVQAQLGFVGQQLAGDAVALHEVVAQALQLFTELRIVLGFVPAGERSPEPAACGRRRGCRIRGGRGRGLR